MSAQPSYPQQPPFVQGPPPPPQQPPAKKRRTWLVVLIVLVVLALLFIAGCTALIGGAAKSVGDAVASASASESNRDAPREVQEGKAFTIGSHETLDGWKVQKADYDQGFNVTGKVKNVSNATSTAFLHFKFINKAGEVIGNVDCNSGDLEPGQTQKLNCIPDGDFGKYTKITAEATF